MTSLTFWFWDVKGPAPGKLLLSKLLSKGEVFERVSPCHVVSRILRIAFTFFNMCASNEIVQCDGDHRRSKLVRLVRKAWPAWRFQSFCVLVLICLLQHLSWFSEAPLWTSAPPATNCVPIQHEGKVEKEQESFETGLGNLAFQRWDASGLHREGKKGHFVDGSCPLSFLCKYSAGIELPQYFLMRPLLVERELYWASRLEAVCSKAKAHCAYLGLSCMFGLFLSMKCSERKTLIVSICSAKRRWWQHDDTSCGGDGHACHRRRAEAKKVKRRWRRWRKRKG